MTWTLPGSSWHRGGTYVRENGERKARFRKTSATHRERDLLLFEMGNFNEHPVGPLDVTGGCKLLEFDNFFLCRECMEKGIWARVGLSLRRRLNVWVWGISLARPREVG